MTSGVPQGCLLGPVLFNVSISYTGSEIKFAISKFADDAKLSAAADMPEGQEAIQRALDRLNRWVHANLIRFNRAKCRVLHQGQGNPWYQYKLGDEGIESRPEKKDLGVLVDERLEMTQ